MSPTVFPGSGSCEPWYLASGPTEQSSPKGESGGVRDKKYENRLLIQASKRVSQS